MTKHLNCLIPRISRSHRVMCCEPVLLPLTLLSANWGSLGECDKTAPWTAICNRAKQALNSKRISRKQKETCVNFTPKKNLLKATQTDYSVTHFWRKSHVISSCYIPLLSKIKQHDMLPRDVLNKTVLTKKPLNN